MPTPSTPATASSPRTPASRRAVADAGLVWIGPPPAAIEAMASKTRAKELMADAGVPLLAPVDPAAATEADLPLLVKAAAGGGGRGMRVVRELAALEGELTAARAEAAAAFGDGEVFVEPYVVGGRHVEVQILADAHGTVWALGTRDCSLQRRHQKVIEEAPAPGLPDALRATLHEAAVRGGPRHRLPGRGHRRVPGLRRRPGLLPGDEHPPPGGAPGHRGVTGLDLVALQIADRRGRGAGRRGRPSRAGTRSRRGCTPRTRRAGWQPQTGTLHRLDVRPDAASGRRTPGSTGRRRPIGVHYDPMLAKVIAWAPDPRRGASAGSPTPWSGPVSTAR